MSNNSDIFQNRLRADLEAIQTVIDTAIDSAKVDQTTVDRIYALLHNTKVQGESTDFVLASSICSLACGILQRTRHPDEGTLRVVKAHIDALSIVVEHDVAGDGGPLGQRMVEQLRGLAQAVGT